MSARLRFFQGFFRRPSSALALIAASFLVYIVSQSGVIHRTPTHTEYLGEHNIQQVLVDELPLKDDFDSNSWSCPSHPGEQTPACSNAHFFPPPQARTIVPSSLISFTPGWTLLTNLYFSNGTFYIVSSEGGFGEGYWPERRLITSTGLAGDHSNGAEREPTEREMDILTQEQAGEIWGDRVFDIQGFSVLANDPNQFLQHYYHVAAEILLGIERVCTNFDPMPGPDGTVSAPSPERLIFLHTDEAGFTDWPGLDRFYLHAQWPHITPLYQPSWEAMASLVSDSRKAWRFPAALFIDRSASFRGPYTEVTSRTPAGPWAAGGGKFGTGGEGRNRFWYESARRRVLSFVGVDREVLDVGLRAMDPPLAPLRRDGKEDVYQVTYISRQRTGRRLIDGDHRRLARALRYMCNKHGWKFFLMVAEDMDREEQMRVAAETTVFVAVHGNGLTHMLLQPPHPRAAIIEMFHPPGFARDYEWTAGILGHRYYTVLNDTAYTPPDLAKQQYPDWLFGKDIPVQAETVVAVVEKQLLGPIPGPAHWQSWREEVGY
ncbi:hypothetical protein DACRYDRAFT_23632 [Dacryopinax primogenitus]|uniref:Glycosyltransferase 61 catalytic domain-containing protein n=1 Tax=Dacryopinax primogenitus (strain DJM 731) TaxID=1858805 RepID=M5FR27_DACPD|nr:uncharacterized protein DACRYDRAFT_23632 [Dacryopinax primogenitus]EJT99500.1 hypothetical protein DACRYDRAFT_23632 [Dacryopinax primogenitus]